MDRDLHRTSLTAIRQMIRKREVSVTELTAHILSRIEAADPILHAYVLVTADRAMARAKQADSDLSAGQPPGSLFGVPIAVKDLFDVSGVPGTCGLPKPPFTRPNSSAIAVQALEDAGAILLGKLTMTEFAFAEYHPDVFAARNPWNLEHSAGVSSSGSAVALAAGLAYATLGTDTGGSIRFPCAATGVTGIKPTAGSISVKGVFPLAPSFDHVGPMASNVEDAFLLLDVLTGLRKPVKPIPKDLTIGFDEEFATAGAHPDLEKALDTAIDALKDAGVRIVPVKLAPIEPATRYWGSIVAAEAAKVHAGRFGNQVINYGPVFASLLKQGRALTNSFLAAAWAEIRKSVAHLTEVFASTSIILLPSAPGPAPLASTLSESKFCNLEALGPALRFTAPFNFSGTPCVCIPAGLERAGMPLGLQLAGVGHSEPQLRVLGGIVEQAFPKVFSPFM